MKTWDLFNKFNKFFGTLTKLNVVQNATLEEKKNQYGATNDIHLISVVDVSRAAALSVTAWVTALEWIWTVELFFFLLMVRYDGGNF